MFFWVGSDWCIVILERAFPVILERSDRILYFGISGMRSFDYAQDDKVRSFDYAQDDGMRSFDCAQDDGMRSFDCAQDDKTGWRQDDKMGGVGMIKWA